MPQFGGCDNLQIYGSLIIPISDSLKTLWIKRLVASSITSNCLIKPSSRLFTDVTQGVP